MDEPKKVAFGGVVIDNEDRILLRRVAGNYKGYVWTFPKGRPDEGELPTDAALREVREETGHECSVIMPLGEFIEGLETVTTFFLMRSVHDHGDFHDETAEVRWASWDEAEKLLSLTEHDMGRARDLRVMSLVRKALV
jgi:8-oxo-dGTP pyrophosphatase MutT (NUDIX family)